MHAPLKFMACALLLLAGLYCAGCAAERKSLKALPSELVWPMPPDEPRIQYLFSISKPEDIGYAPSFFSKALSLVTGPGDSVQLVRPYGIFSTPEDVVYVADPGLKIVHAFDMKRSSYSQITSYKDRALQSPIGITMDDSRRLYVSDSLLKRIFVFSDTGKPLMEIGADDKLLRPTGLAFHSVHKWLYVTDTLGHCVHVFDRDGTLLNTFGSRGTAEGTFNFPTAIAFDREGNVYVNDSLNFRIQIFKPDGTFVSLFGKHGDGMGEFSSPKGISLDSEGNIYIADAIFDAVQIFNRSGALLLSFCEAGTGPGALWLPSSIFIDQADRIFIADSYNQRVQVFKFLGGNNL
ncbi:MAG: 6-bladed beta-propeller [Pseudomonadota bacterium]